jgi:signal transduction histidine kinase
VVRQIVEQHDGTARATDAPGGGARIVVELPGWRAGPEAPPAASTLGNGGEA